MSPPEVVVTDPRRRPVTLMERFQAYAALAKLRIIELLLITTVPAMVLAAGEWPGTWLVIATLVGGTLSAGGANAPNKFAPHPLPPDAEGFVEAHSRLALIDFGGGSCVAPCHHVGYCLH